jgi:NAD(P)-dependent dehydrogenase (short-subunit alcohol dehydrogenase family)
VAVSTLQEPLVTGYGARTPASEVIDGIDLTRKLAVADLDLADLASVASFAEELLRSGRSIDILVNNAAVMACPEARVGTGWESQSTPMTSTGMLPPGSGPFRRRGPGSTPSDPETGGS